MKIIILSFIFCFNLFAQELTITMPNNLIKITTKELLAHPKLESLVLNDPAYNSQTYIYKAIPLYELLRDLPKKIEGTLKYTCKDGFNSSIDLNLILNSDENKSIAYLAIEEPNKKWKVWKKFNDSLGPYYIMWKNPKLSNIKKELWPFQVVALEIEKPFSDRYYKIIPKTKKSSRAYKGFKVFKDNCFACHKMNSYGESEVGPDLNLPMNPIEYYKIAALKKLIRDPKSVRDWNDLRMTGFSEEEISDIELDYLIEYLNYMRLIKKN